jgi:hypothetical protein
MTPLVIWFGVSSIRCINVLDGAQASGFTKLQELGGLQLCTRVFLVANV